MYSSIIMAKLTTKVDKFVIDTVDDIPKFGMRILQFRDFMPKTRD